MLSFLWYRFRVLSFMLSFDVIIFHGQQMLSFSLVHNFFYHLCYHLMLSFFTFSKCYHFYVIIYGIIFRVLSFMLSFDVIIFHGQQVLSFLCYHFPLYIFCVIIYVIIWCYHFSWSANVIILMLSFFLIPVGCYHLCYHLILSFIVIISPLFSFSWEL